MPPYIIIFYHYNLSCMALVIYSAEWDYIMSVGAKNVVI